MKRKITAYMIGLVVTLLSIVPVLANDMDIEFTDEELEYISGHPNVLIGVDPDFSPYEFIDNDGIYKGIAADYVKLIEVKTGLNFIPAKNLTWVEAHDMAADGKLDVLPCVGITEQRRKLFDFSESYLQFQRVVISRDDEPAHSIHKLDGLRVGVQRNSSHFGYVVSELGLDPVLYETTEDVLRSLSRGDIDVAISNFASSRYQIKELGFTNLKIDEVLDSDTTEFAMAVTKNNPLLLSIINKSLKQITKEEKITVQNKWLGIEQAADYSGFWRIIIVGGTGVIVLIVFFAFWNYTLKKEIKQRKRIEEELRLAKIEAEEANAAKSIFLARMSHEIRTPLNAISGLGYLLENTKTTTIQVRYIKNLKAASNNLLNIINDILDFSKIEAGEIKIEKIEFALDDLLDKVSNLLRPRAMEKSIGFHVIRDISLKEKYYGDPTRIEQVIINLVNNAIKFTHEGDVQIQVTLEKQTGNIMEVAFNIQDTGIGISEEQREHLFVPFHQLDSSITRNYGGTGLGLSISKNIVELLGGYISVSSEFGKGSSFRFVLPLEIVIGEKKRDIGTLYPDLREVKALIYEEDEISRKVVVEYLHSFHIQADMVTSGKEVIERIRQDKDKYVLLFMNLNLKAEDSLEIVKKVKNPHLHVILLAKHVQESQFEAAEQIGVKHIIMQPVIASILYNSIVQCFSQEIAKDVGENSLEIVKVASHNILLVEDNEVNQMIEKEILQQKGYHVEIANNGLEAVQMMEEPNQFELILMDIHMPVMDGYEATRKIREGNSDIPILAMTAVSFTNIKKECQEAGMDDYVTKPVEPDELFATISKYVVDHEVENISVAEVSERKSKENEKYINTKQGMKRIGNNEKLYREVIEKFYEDIGETKDRVSEHIKNKEYELANKEVHRIKGCSGNVGAMQLFQSSKLLMDAINSGIEVDIAPYLLEFEKDMEKTIQTIISMQEQWNFEQQPKKKATYHYTQDIKEKVEYLEELLEKSDLDAFQIMDQLTEMIPGDNDQWNEIQHYMKQYKFNEALEGIKKILT